MHRTFSLFLPVWWIPGHSVLCCHSTWTPEPSAVTSAVLLWTPFPAAWWPWIVAFGILIAASVILVRRMFFSLRREVMAQREFLRGLIESQEHQRTKIAAVLRENIGRRLIAVRSRVSRRMALRPHEEREPLGEIGSLTGEAISILRQTALDLHPHRLDTRGLTDGIRSLVLRQSTDISFATDLESIDGILPPGLEINLYRIVEESINNIIRHSGATRAHIFVRRDPTVIHITIQDNGRGLQHSELHTAGPDRVTSGFLIMAERARMMGGMLTVDSPGSAGTIVTLTVPR